MRCVGLGAVALLLASPAFAQSAPWTDPTGRFTLAYADLGWSGPPVPENPDGYVLAVGNSTLGVGGGRPAVCAVRHSPSARVSPATPPERINALTDGLDESALQRLHHTNVRMENLARLEIDGVHVIDYISSANGAWQHWRTFWLLQGDQVFMYDVACTAVPPISAEASANIGAVLQTLHFLPASARSAPPQSSQRWTDPTGSWSMDFVAQGWGHAEPLPRGLPNLTLMTAPAASPSSGEERMCFVMQAPITPADTSLAAIRNGARGFNAAAAAALPGGEGQRAATVTYSEVDGVAVAEVDSVSRDGAQARHHRIFDLPSKGGAQRINIDCFWSAHAPANRVAEVQAILASVRINPETSP